MMVATLLYLYASTVSAGEAGDLSACIPDSAMIAWFGRPSPAMLDAPPGGVVDRLASWLLTLKAAGVIPPDAQVVADAVATIPLLGRRPHALALLDLTIRELSPGSYRLNSLQAAAVVDVGPLAGDFDRRIRDLLATYTSAEHNVIETVAQDGLYYHRLTDSIQPEWAVVEWGTFQGRLLVVGVGRGALQAVAETIGRRRACLADEDWFAQAHQACHGARSGLECHVHVEALSRRLGEIAPEETRRVIGSLGLGETRRLLWAVGFEGRVLRSEACLEDLRGQTLYAVLSGPGMIDPAVEAMIPEEADAYAAFRLPLPEVARGLRKAYLDSQGSQRQEKLRRMWSRLEEQFEFSAEHQFIGRLGTHLIFHTYPPHPLRLPLMCSVWIQTDGQTEAIARTLDGMMAAWQDALSPATRTAPAGTRPSRGLSPQIRRTPDGIWYLQLGVLGPAMGVADGWIVISFSPLAVRDNLSYLRRQASDAASQPADRVSAPG